MVSYFDGDLSRNPETLGDWVKNFRLKKIHMKRKLRSNNLRVCAILSTALRNAESELRRKQQERSARWMQYQKELSENIQQNYMKSGNYPIRNEAPTDQQKRDIESLWRNELSDLDNFMRSMSSTTNSNSSDGSSNNNNIDQTENSDCSNVMNTTTNNNQCPNVIEVAC